MPKPSCPHCKDTGLIAADAGNEWCECPAGREFISEINKARAKAGKAPVVEAAKPSGQTLH